MNARAADCRTARELLSALADDEQIAPAERAALGGHLAECDECRRFESQLAAFTRAIRLRPVAIDPGFVAGVMERSRPPRLGRGGWVRPALVWCGAVIAVRSARPLLLGDLAGAETHVARHVGAFSLALAIGLLYAAWRPQRAFGLMPLAGALLVTTAAGTVLDLLGGDRSALAEVAHLSELVGAALLWMVAGSPGWDRVVGRFRAVARPTT